MVGYPSDVREIMFGANGVGGVVHCMNRGTFVVDMTTSEPSLAQEIYDIAKARGISSIDAPVSGGDVGAKQARLTIMAGGDDQAVAYVRPLLELLGKNINHLGGPGMGQHTKMVNQVRV